MPIFEYKCDACGTKFEKLLRRSDDLNALSCPDCGERHLSQQYSTFAARANGSASSSAAAEMPSCPSGMCSNPGICGRN
jgi:putative FmdB family regulatory protein